MTAERFSPKICILMASRLRGNPNMDFHSFMDSLMENTAHPRNLEILVKLDDDDREHPLAVGGIDYPIRVYVLKTPRAGGYADLHKAYMDLMCHASHDAELFWVLSDDVKIGTKGWDGKALDIAVAKRGWPHVINTISDLNMGEISKGACIGNVDTYPMWNRTWLAIAGMGSTFNTDGYTGMLCHSLENDFKIGKAEYRTFLPTEVKRGDDHNEHRPDDERFNGVRKWQLRKMESTLFSDHMQNMAWIKAGMLAMAIRGNRK